MNKVDDILEKLKNTEQPQIDLTEEIMNSLSPRPLQGERKPKRRVSPLFWRGIGGGLIAASIILLLVFNYNNKVEPVKQPVVAEVVEQQPAPEAPKDSEYSDNSESSENSENSEPVKPKKTYKVRKAQEKPQLAEAEPRVEENEVEAGDGNHTIERTDPMLLAAAFEQDIRARGERLCQEIIQITTKQ